MTDRPLPAIEQLLPHRGWMLLLTELREAGDGHALCAARVPLDCPLVDAGGRAPAVLGIEMGAQCAGVLAGVAAARDGQPAAPTKGYLVRVSAAELAVPDLPAGRELLVEARRTGGAGGLGVFEIAVRDDPQGEPLVSATLATLAAPAAVSSGDR